MSNINQFIEQVTGKSHLRVEQDLGDGFVLLRSAEAERRQAKHDIRSSEDIVIEMLRNSRDAHSSNIFVASWKEKDIRNITVIDDGDGIPESMIKRIFDARVTSKLDTMKMDIWGIHGRGMALFAIKENTDKALVTASLQHGGGTAIHVESSTQRLCERKDQSTYPTFHTDENGTTTVRGPKNICRTVIEFAYIEQGTCKVYFGSPAEIAASLYGFGRATLSQDTLVFCQDLEKLPVPCRLAACGSPDAFSSLANSLGLPMSTRTARRVLNSEIKAVLPISPQDYKKETSPTSSLSLKDKNETENPNCKPKSNYASDIDAVINKTLNKGVHIAREDMGNFTAEIQKAFSDLAAQYYLDQDAVPIVTTSHNKLTITIPLIEKQ